MTDQAQITIGDKIRFTPQNDKIWWTVQARDERFIIATRQAPFRPKGDEWYTVVDLTGWTYTYNGVRPGVIRSYINVVGGGWDRGWDEALRSLQSGEFEPSRRGVMAVDGIEVKP